MSLFTRIVLILFVLSGVFGYQMANEQPLWCRIDGQSYWPAISAYAHPALVPYRTQQNWATLPASDKVMPPIPFSGAISTQDKKFKPLQRGAAGRHWLGTDAQGRDVLAGLLHGARVALLSALLALGGAMVPGITLGAIAGFWGDTGITLKRGVVISLTAGGAVLFFLLFFSAKNIFLTDGWSSIQALGITGVVLLLSVGAGLLISRWPWWSQSGAVRADMYIMRAAELFESVPLLVVLLAAISLLPGITLNGMMLLIGVFLWPGVARLLRAELLKVRQKSYIQAVRDLGYPEWRVFFRHALPNALPPLLVALSAAAAGAVLVESSLSFLGLGRHEVNALSWGNMLQTARENISLWWVWLPPGIVIGLLAAALYEWSGR